MSMHVAAGVLIDRRGRVLIAQRPAGKALAGAWEFPGGKLEPGETAAAGLARELEEELGLTIRAPRPLMKLRHRYPHAQVLLEVFIVRRWHGRLERRDGQRLQWVRRGELGQLPLLPADRPILDALWLPARLQRRSTARYRLEAMGPRSARGAGAAGAGGPQEGVTRAGGVRAGGVRAARAQVTAARSAARARAPSRRVLLGARCRTGRQARGCAREVDFIVLERPLDDRTLAALCRALACPVYASGLSLERAWALGASGVHAL